MEPFCLSKLGKNSGNDFGGKAIGLSQLMQEGLLVPLTFGLTKAQWQAVKKDQKKILQGIHPESFDYPLMVRSSADCEDHESFSFAGVFKSIRVENPRLLKAGIETVMNSILDEKNQNLFESLGIDFETVFPGFLIQPYLETVKRGVAFSRNPNDLWDQNAWIEVSSRHQDSVVEGNSETQVIDEISNQDAFYKQLFHHLHALEKKYKMPIDLEWGQDQEGKLVFFQMRPISGRGAEKLRGYLHNPQLKWSRELAEERFPQCLTPLGFDVVMDGVPTNLKSLQEYFGIKTGGVSEMVYSDEGWVYHSEHFFKFPGGLKINLFQFLKKRSRFIFHFFISLLKFIGRTLLLDPARLLKWKVDLVHSAVNPIQNAVSTDFTIGMKQILALKEELNHFLTPPASKQEVVLRMKRINEVAQVFLKTDFAIYIAKEALFNVYQKLWEYEGNKEFFLDHASRLKKNISLTQIKSSSELNFARTSWDIYFPSVSEQYQPLQSEGQKQPNKAALAPLSNHWSERIARLQQWMEWDEELHHYTGVLIEASRRVVLSAAEEMVKEKILIDRELVFFLTLKEIHAFLSGKMSSLQGRAVYRQQRFFARRALKPDATIPPEPSLHFRVEESSSSVHDFIQGQVMSSGVAHGKYLFLNHFNELPSASDEPFILVTQTSNPVWISLFPKIKGWITERGGPLAHGFVAARDYGIPAMSKVNLSELLKKAQNKSILMNAEKGRIEVLP